MSYKHLLVAVDLTPSSELVIAKAVALAKDGNAKISLIYVDVDYGDNYTGLSYSEYNQLAPISQRANSLQRELDKLADKTDYPITERIFLSGDLHKNLQLAVENLGADLLVCGHHHDFWRRLLSSIRKLINTSLIDLLIVQL